MRLRTSILFAVALLLAVTALSTGSASAHSHSRMYRLCHAMITVAHRGEVRTDGTLGPNEDTLWSQNRGAAVGADMTESDVHLDADRTWWEMHDGTVDRMTQGTGQIANLTDAEMRQLRTPAGSRVPTFDQYAKNIHVPLQQEIKRQPSWLHVSTEDYARLVDIVDAAGVRQKVNWSSSVIANLEAMHQLAPDMPDELIMPLRTSVDLGTIPQWMYQINVTRHEAVARHGRFRHTVGAIHAAGFRVSVRYATQPSQWRQMINLHVNQLVLDNVSAYDRWCNSR